MLLLCALIAGSSSAWADEYVKVTSTGGITDGEYLIVYEAGSVAFDGSLSTLDATGNTVAVTINDGKIASSAKIDAATFTIDVTKGTLKSSSGLYIGVSSNSNGLKQIADENAYKNSFAIDGDGNAVISAVFSESTMTLRYNKATNQLRFRYYKNAGYDKSICLYKADQEIAPQPACIPDTVSVVQAIAVVAEEKTHYVKGIVGEISTSAEDLAKYHNIDFMLADIDDVTKQIKCYRLWWEKMNGEFKGGEIASGDTILVYGQTTIYTDKEGNKINEIANGYVVEVLGKGDGTGPIGPTPHGDPLDIDYAEAAYIVDEEGPYWMLYGGKYPADETQMYLDYPIIILYVENADGKHIAGTYNIYEGSTLYTSDNDSIEFVSGSVLVTCVEAGNELYPPYYNIVATLYDAQGREYVYEFETEVWAYDYESDEDIVLEDQPTQGIENTVVYEFDPKAPIYNIQGMQVDRNTRGVLIQNGNKFMINGL